MQSDFPLGFNDNICQEGNISKMSKMSDSDVLSLLNVRNVKLDLMVNEIKTAKFSAKNVPKKAIIPLYRSFSCF